MEQIIRVLDASGSILDKRSEDPTNRYDDAALIAETPGAVSVERDVDFID